MKLFNRLLSIHKLHTGVVPQEDFFTEIVAYLFITSPEILFAWIKLLNLLEAQNYKKINISTQVSFAPLEGQAIGSRFDVLIELSDETCRDWIVIESKIGSLEGHGQLKRYAEILAARQDIRQRALVYITRHFEPKDENLILQDISGTTAVRFVQSRWYAFYHFLRKQPSNALIDEVIAFMEENGMSQDNQFAPVHVVSLSNLLGTINIMGATLSEKVCARFEEILGPVNKSESERLTWLEEGQYQISAGLGKDWHCGMGYDLRVESAIGYPILSLWLEVYPSADSRINRPEIIAAMRQICKRPGWKGYDLDQVETWSGVSRGCSLQDFLSKEDHVAAIEAYFLELLEELAKIKKQYRHLPWGTGIE